PGRGGIGGHLVADQEERRLGVVGAQGLKQPVGERPRPVVERQRHAFDPCAVHAVRRGGGWHGGDETADKPQQYRRRADPARSSTPGVVLRAGSARHGQGRAPGLISSSISVTRAAIGERSLRSSVMWANSGWPLSFSITAATPS